MEHNFAVPLPPSTFYTCPGERHAIPRSVHLARLGRSYAACQQCPHRTDTGLVPTFVLNRVGEQSASATPQTRFVPSGLRGRYLNDFTRQEAYRWGIALAGVLWQDRPWTGRLETDDSCNSLSAPQPTAPVVVVGYDERPSSPDLAIGVVTGLRHAGVCVLDIGMVTSPLWRFATTTLNADAGLLITGSGNDVNWTGCDLLGHAGQMWQPERELAQWYATLQHSQGRPTRTASSVQSMAVAVPYQAHLRRHFHALRPLTIGCATSSAVLAHHLNQVVTGLPVTLQCNLSPDWRAPLDLASRIAQCSAWSQPDLIVWIAEDGEHVQVYDSQHRAVDNAAMNTWLLAAAQREDMHSHRRVIHACQQDLSAREFDQLIRQPETLAGIDTEGRYWCGGSASACDAILTLAAILRAMSWSDAPLAEQVELAAGA